MKARLLLSLTALLFALTSWAVGVEIDGIHYLLNSSTNTATVARYTSSTNNNPNAAYKGNITIPASVSYGGTTYTVTSIGDEAFKECTGLTNISIPSSVTNIGGWAFEGCTGLASINLPASVTTIGDDAFWCCTGLTSINIPSSVTAIGHGAFHGCTGLTSVSIPASVTTIGNYAFTGCEGLASIKVEAGNIAYDSRENCNAIIETASNTLVAGCMNTTVPNSVTAIGDYAFLGCTGLTSFTIPASVTAIGDYAFSDCSGLASIKVEAGNTAYDSRENCNAIIETASNTLVAGCMNTTIPNSVTAIGDGAFLGCTGLASISIPASVTTIGNRAFYGCTSLTSINIPSSVTTIGYKAFLDCTGLKSISIPASVTAIGDWAFYGCTGLTNIYAEHTDPEAYHSSDYAFSDVPFSTCTLHVPIGSKEAYANTAPWSKFKNIVEAAAQTARHPVQSRTHKQKGARKGGSNTKKSK